MSTLSLLLCCCLALPSIGYRLNRAIDDSCGIDGANLKNCGASQICARPPICEDRCMWKCRAEADPTTTVSPPLCGQSSIPPPSSATSFVSIVGGQTAPVGAIPWQVAVYTRRGFRCGGSYVLNSKNELKVITAAHCVTGVKGSGSSARNYFVRFGMHDRTVTTDVIQVTAHSIVRHRAYRRHTATSDIAIISFGGLSYDALAGTYASPICLVSTSYTDGEMAMVSGWGRTSESGSSSQQLQYVNTRIMDYNYCNTETGNAGYLDSTMLCAADEGKDACQGDSGSPLVVYRDNQWQLAGVVSWGWGCARENFPGVYSDVNSLRPWIDENL